MKRFCKSLFCYICLAVVIVSDSFAGDVITGALDINTDFVVYENVVFNPDVVYVGRPIDFTNYGDVDTKFVVCDRCDLYIKNRGNFKAEFVVGTAANVYQVVRLFAYVGRGVYECLGENYPYEGPVYAQPKGSKTEIIVGAWKKGIFTSNVNWECHCLK